MTRIRTALVGSYAQPEWLIDRAALRNRLPARIPAGDMWRIEREFLQEAMNDAVLSILRDQEEAGIDIVTDGEVRRESYSAPMANAPAGINRERSATLVGRAGKLNQVPLISGPLKRLEPVHVEDVKFLRARTDKTVKITLPGPFTLSQLAVNEYYNSTEEVALAYAECINGEVQDLFAAGADIVQFDEPYLQPRHEEARKYGVKAVNRALEGVNGTTALHVCFGYAAMVGDKSGNGYSCLSLVEDMDVDQVSIETAQPQLDLGATLNTLPGKTILVGVLNLGDETPETPAMVADRLRKALEFVPAERIIAAPDCGLKYLPRQAARHKLKALVQGTAVVNAELSAG